MNTDNPLGQVVYSKVGRDRDEYYIVVGILNHNYVYISDGRLRKVEKPKKKKCKHLIFTGTYAEEIQEAISNGKYVSNSKIRNFLESMYSNKEV